MNYKDYMDRQSVDEGFHARLLALEKKQKKGRPRWGVAMAAALCCVVGLSAWGLMNSQNRDLPLEETVVLEEGEALPKLHYSSGTGAMTASDVGLPKGYFYRDMTEEQIASLWSTGWEIIEAWGLFSGLDVTGRIIYDGQGVPWQIEINGEEAESGEELHLRLSPNMLPPECMGLELKGNTVYGTTVGAYCRKTSEGEDGAGRWDYEAAFLHEGEQTVGVRIEFLSYDSAAAQERLSRIVYYSLREDVLRVLQLSTEDIPAWRSEQPSEAEAYALPDFMDYLPAVLPEGYSFSGAWLEQGEDRYYMSVEWTCGVQYISLSIDRMPGEVVPVNINETEAYDLRYYNSADKPEPPEKYWGIIENPIFRMEDLSEEIIVARLYTYPNETASQADFQVLFGDGVLIRLHCRGTAAEIWEMLCSIPACKG